MPRSTTKWVSAGLLACLAAFAVPASAGPVVYDNGAPNQASGNNMSFAYQAEDFVLAAKTTISDVHFWSLEAATAYRGGFYWALHDNSGGAPGALIADGFQKVVTRTPGAVAGFGTEFRNDFDLNTATALLAGTYWLVLHNGAFGNLTDDGLDFLWETTAVAKGFAGHEDDGTGWTPNGAEHAFQLTGPNVVNVPEPMTGGLVAAALAALLFTRQRARRRG